MKELVVISGKGGTGKTSLVASLAVLARQAVIADCDVDASNLHLVLEASIIQRQAFSGGAQATIKPDLCSHCGQCLEVCRFNAVKVDQADQSNDKKYEINPIACEGCGVCHYFCPQGAIEFSAAVNGEWFISTTRVGPMVHARLGIAQENSGKLVSLVRTEAYKIGVENKRSLALIDGSPGIGCAVIASITGADNALVVTEPTMSGLHDLERVIKLTRHFNIPTMVCVNKWDINEDMTEKIRSWCQQNDVALVGQCRYDSAVTKAQVQKKAVVEYTQEGISEDIENLWSELSKVI